MNKRYQIKDDEAKSGWFTVTRASELSKDGTKNGWLHWEIRTKDGTSNGMSKPGNWRVRP